MGDDATTQGLDEMGWIDRSELDDEKVDQVSERDFERKG